MTDSTQFVDQMASHRVNHPDWEELCEKAFPNFQLNWFLNYIKSHDINQCTDKQGNTLLHHSIQIATLQPAQLLAQFIEPVQFLAQFIDPNIHNFAGQTAFQLAQDSEAIDTEVFHLHNLCIDFAKASSEPNGLDALFAAIYRGDATLGDTSGVEDDGNEMNEGGWTALQCAAMYDRPQLIRELHQRFPNLDVNMGDNPALQLAAEHGHLNCIIALCECFPAIQVGNALHVACQFNRLACIPTLRECFPGLTGNELDDDDELHPPVLQSAVKSNNPECIRALHACFPNINPNLQDELGNTALIAAVKYCENLTCVSVLSECFLDIDPNKQDINDETALMSACQHNKADAIILLHSYFPNIDVNLRNAEGKTALMMAIYWLLQPETQDDTCLITLWASFPDIDPNIQDQNGDTALIMTSWSDHPEILAQLHRYFPNIDPNIQNNEQDTVLAILSNFSASIDALRQFVNLYPNVDPNIQNDRADTPFAVAIKNGNLSTITFFMECFPNIYPPIARFSANSAGPTGLTLAIQENQLDVVALFLNFIIQIE